jgi:predicted DCC family thiol-disulfide oxidoreductase YuxK
MNINKEAFSYRTDKSVPKFNDDGLRTVMDARCGLCAKGAKWIAKNDTLSEFRIIPLQSELGSTLMRHYGMDPDDPLSWLFIEDGLAYSSLDAVIRTGNRLGGKWKFLSVLRIFPRSLQDFVYGLVARNRYKFFGQTDMCSLPDPDIQKRLLQ